MLTIIRNQHFNKNKIVKINQKFFVMTKGNVFQFLKDSEINSHLKNEIFNELDEISGLVEIVADSYKKFVHDKMLSINQSVFKKKDFAGIILPSNLSSKTLNENKNQKPERSENKKLITV